MLYLGIDVGSLSCDAVLVDQAGHAVAWAVVPTGARNREAIARARREALAAAGAGPGEIGGVIATGYGRNRVEGRLGAVTEITCHARGAGAVLAEADVIIDIGGQDSKAIRVAPGGKVLDFAMNDKCAAGTGRFLEAMARALEVDVDELAGLDEGDGGARGPTSDLTISSVCTVFAESEVVSLVAEGRPVPDIVRGIHRSVAARTRSLVRRVARDLTGLRLGMTGGVARNAGVVRALEATLGVPIAVPPEPDTVGALGAALIARDRAS